MNQSNDSHHAEHSPTILVKPKSTIHHPSLYKVFLLNDDYTPMDFVIHVLEQFFNKSHTQAKRLMLLIHTQGVGLCGLYTYEVAETKVAEVSSYARYYQHPLKCTMEKE